MFNFICMFLYLILFHNITFNNCNSCVMYLVYAASVLLLNHTKDDITLHESHTLTVLESIIHCQTTATLTF